MAENLAEGLADQMLISINGGAIKMPIADGSSGFYRVGHSLVADVIGSECAETDGGHSGTRIQNPLWNACWINGIRGRLPPTTGEGHFSSNALKSTITKRTEATLVALAMSSFERLYGTARVVQRDRKTWRLRRGQRTMRGLIRIAATMWILSIARNAFTSQGLPKNKRSLHFALLAVAGIIGLWMQASVAQLPSSQPAS